jgi:hypothetical protein
LSQSSSQSGRVRSCARLRAEGVLRPSPPRTREKREISDGRRAGVAKLGGPVAELRRETGTRVNILEIPMKIPEECTHAEFLAIAAGSLWCVRLRSERCHDRFCLRFVENRQTNA